MMVEDKERVLREKRGDDCVCRKGMGTALTLASIVLKHCLELWTEGPCWISSEITSQTSCSRPEDHRGEGEDVSAEPRKRVGIGWRKRHRDEFGSERQEKEAGRAVDGERRVAKGTGEDKKKG